MKKGIYIRGFNERFNEAILSTGLSQLELARRLECDHKWLITTQRTGMPESGMLARFCKVTNTSADWLLGLSDKKTLKGD